MPRQDFRTVDLPADFWMEMQAHKAMLRHVADICEQAVRSNRSPVAGAARAPEAVPEKAERKVESDAVQAAAVPSNPQEVTAINERGVRNASGGPPF
jgi:hypothetical protein